eukprot:gene4509-8964_t
MTVSVIVVATVLFCGCIVNNVAFFQNSYSRKYKVGQLSTMMSSQLGLHGANFKFLPSTQFGQSDHYPRIIHVAGVYPGITTEELIAPLSPPRSPQGTWTFDFPDADGPQAGIVAVPGSEVITACEDPIVIVSSSNALGMNIASSPSSVLVVVDRADREFYSSDFFVFRTPDDIIEIGNSVELIDGYEILGRIVMCVLPFREEMRKSTGFLEDEDL